MKSLYALLFLICMTFSLYGQQNDEDNDEYQTIIGSDDLTVSGFGGPVMTFSSFDNDFALFMGGGGAALINNRFFFGGFGQGMTNSASISDTILNKNYDKIEFGYGGIWLGYMFNANKAIHPVLHTQIGFGGISYQNSVNNSDRNDPVLVLAPGLEIEMNVTNFFKLGAGVKYRYVLGVDEGDYTSSDFSSLGGFLTFKFGWF